jgi:2-dehydro-3-deoxyphosphogluconate aldolase/(4S)-4-hydroxy-2-oxoglutarate aldolase
MTLLDAIIEIGVVPVVVIDEADDAPALAEALLAGGLPCVEVTLRTEAALRAIDLLARNQQLIVGAGTVLDRGQVGPALAAGARFVISPGVDVDVIQRSHERGVPAIPGVATSTEVMRSLAAGVNVVKLFPAEALGGLPMLDALAAPFPDVRFLPTGGIGPAQLPDYLGHSSVAAVGGSWIAPRSLLRERRFPEIAERAAAAVAAVAAAGRTRASWA